MIIWQTLKVTGLMLALFTLSKVAAIAPKASSDAAFRIELGSRGVEFDDQNLAENPTLAVSDSTADTLIDVVSLALSQAPETEFREGSPTEAQPTEGADSTQLLLPVD